MNTIYSALGNILGINTVREEAASLLSMNDSRLNDMGLTRFQVEKMADLPYSYDSVRASTVLTAYVHGEVAGSIR